MPGMGERALSFGTVAVDYERYRLGYPGELADAVLAYAGAPVRTALEIGAGTGKATRVFAARGIAVTATDPDPAMLAVLCEQVPGVETRQAKLEALRPDRHYDLVYAAASLHWTEAGRRWERIAALLAPGGVFASVGGVGRLADPVVEQAVEAARAPFLDSDDIPPPDDTSPEAEMQWPGTELEKSALFGDVRQVVLGRRLTVSADDYVGKLSTVSAYLMLPDPVRDQVFQRIRAVLPDPVDLFADLMLHLARRR